MKVVHSGKGWKAVVATPNNWTPSVIGGEPSRFVDGVAWRPRFMLLSVIDAMIVT